MNELAEWLIGGLIITVIILWSFLVCCNEREKTQDAEYETLLTQYQLLQMQIREMAREQRREKANPR